jgi:prolyl-tRNA synthetase
MNKFENFSKWFDNLLFNAEILDNRYPIKGFSVYKTWGTKIINKIKNILEERLISTSHDPMLFPVTISEDSFSKESEHIEGFNTEVFWITHAGNRELKKKMLLRPTSETAMYPMFKYWIRSHADLPLKIYQTVSVYRYETKSTRPLLRMREFLWNEAHTAHQDFDEAEKQVKEAVVTYSSIFKKLGISYYVLKRPDFDKFAGSIYSIAFDAWNPDGRVNQIGTVHNLGQNFAKAFNLEYEDLNGTTKSISQTCYGLGISRVLAAIIAQHGDDHGMVIPSLIAPIQVVVIPIKYKEFEKEIKEYSLEVYKIIKKALIRVKLDDREKTPGEKYYYWEMRGIPLRVEIGPRELKNRNITISERISSKRKNVEFEKMIPTIKSTFKELDKKILDKSRSILMNITIDVKDLDELQKVIADRKIARTCWCESIKCANKINEVSSGEIRGHRIEIKEKPAFPCIVCSQESKKVVYVARAY